MEISLQQSFLSGGFPCWKERNKNGSYLCLRDLNYRSPYRDAPYHPTQTSRHETLTPAAHQREPATYAHKEPSPNTLNPQHPLSNPKVNPPANKNPRPSRR